jgi:hypothetical protein
MDLLRNILTLHKAGGIMDTSLVLGAAEGIVTAKNPGLLAIHGDHIEIVKFLGEVPFLLNGLC